MHFCRPELDIALCLSIIEEHVWIFHSSKVKFVVRDWYSSNEENYFPREFCGYVKAHGRNKVRNEFHGSFTQDAVLQTNHNFFSYLVLHTAIIYF